MVTAVGSFEFPIYIQPPFCSVVRHFGFHRILPDRIDLKMAGYNPDGAGFFYFYGKVKVSTNSIVHKVSPRIAIILICDYDNLISV
jgi:hypothetical protein